MAVQSSSEVDASDVVPCPRQQGLEVLIKTTKTNQDRGLRLVCELCAKAKRGAQEHFASEEEQAAATEEATMEKAWIDRPREYATVGRLATHVWAAHGVGNSIVDALQPELKADLLSQHGVAELHSARAQLKAQQARDWRGSRTCRWQVTLT